MSLVHSGNRMVLQSRFPQKQEGGVLWTGISGIVSALAWSQLSRVAFSLHLLLLTM